MEKSDRSDVEHVAKIYASALWMSDVETLRSIFHERCNLYGVESGELDEYSLEQWLSIVGAREPGVGEAEFQIIDVSCVASELAMVTLNCEVVGRKFTDGLSLPKFNNGWKVVAKTFHIRAT